MDKERKKIVRNPMRHVRYICHYCNKPTDNPIFRKVGDWISIPVCDVCLVRMRFANGKQ